MTTCIHVSPCTHSVSLLNSSTRAPVDSLSSKSSEVVSYRKCSLPFPLQHFALRQQVLSVDIIFATVFFLNSPCRGWYQILLRHHLESLQFHHIIIWYQWIAYEIVRILDPTIYLYFMYYYILSKLYISLLSYFPWVHRCIMPKTFTNRPCANVPRHHLSVHLQPLPKQPLLFDRMEPS